ncbi:ATP-grasp domain-containing protein [Mycobacterium sp. ML4]
MRKVFARREVTLLDVVDDELSCPADDVDPRGILRRTAETRAGVIRYRAGDLAPAARALSAARPAFVFYGFEYDLPAADRLAALVCPQFANDPATSSARERKDETDRLLRDHGYPVPREVSFQLHKPLDERLLDGLGESLIIKPVRYAGKHAIVSRDGVHSWLRDARGSDPDPHAAYTAQELLIDRDAAGMQQTYSIDGFALGGEYYFVSLQRWHKFVLSDGVRYCWAEQLDVSAAEHASLLAHTRELLKALGHQNGFFHPEFTASPRGPVLIDLNPRLAGAGGMVDRMIGAAQGVGVIDTFVDLAFGEPMLAPEPRRQVRLLAIYGLRDDEVETVSALPSVEELFGSAIMGCHFVLLPTRTARRCAGTASFATAVSSRRATHRGEAKSDRSLIRTPGGICCKWTRPLTDEGMPNGNL